MKQQRGRTHLCGRGAEGGVGLEGAVEVGHGLRMERKALAHLLQTGKRNKEEQERGLISCRRGDNRKGQDEGKISVLRLFKQPGTGQDRKEEMLWTAALP